MLRDAVTLDAAMSVRAALSRLARQGYWSSPTAPEAHAYLEQYASKMRAAAELREPFIETYRPQDDSSDDNVLLAEREVQFAPATMTSDEAAELLARPIEPGRVAIRRQEGVTIFWYAKTVAEILRLLEIFREANPSVREALDLHEHGSQPVMQATNLDDWTSSRFQGVVLRGQDAVAIGDASIDPDAVVFRSATRRGGTRSSDPTTVGAPGTLEPAAEVRAFPRLKAPQTVVVGEQFDLVVGLSDTPIAGVASSGQIVLPVKKDATTLPLDIQVVSEGFDADAWQKRLDISVREPTKAQVTIHLTPRAQNEPVRLTKLLVHFIMDGVLRGAAARHIIVEQKAGDAGRPDDRGQFWPDAELPPPNLNLAPVAAGPDIEVDIAKPDGNAASGAYTCVIRNAHGIPAPSKELTIQLGDDAKTFAKTLIDEVRTLSGDALVDNLVQGVGKTIARKLPDEFWDTLSAVARKVTSRPLTLQLNSAEPYVPWELALVENPVDPTRPNYLAAQVIMGRWILGDRDIACPPQSEIPVRAMVVMAGMYNITSGLKELPHAIEEAQSLAASYASLPAVPLDFTSANFKTLLDAKLVHNFKAIGIEAVHLAGHGEVNPQRPGDAALFTNDGKPLSPRLFLTAQLGKKHRPFMFLNACMVGVGGELLGSYEGFPGCCLIGGFTALLAPLWAVNDDVAKSFALEFYDNALVKGGGRPVAEVLRDLRAKYDSNNPVVSYLAYVYYGSPHLRLSYQGA